MRFEQLDGHEQVVFASDPRTGLRCIIAIHSTVMGPALGGTRFRAYPDDEAALEDVLRLSRAMTYKAACAGLDLGGGKAVIIGDPTTDKTTDVLRAYGRVVESLGGRYVTAGDMGTTPADLAHVARESRFVTGLPPHEGGSGDSGITTALGVFLGVRATVRHVFGDEDLAGRHIVVQGLGKVGGRLCEHLLEAGARLTVADVVPAAVDRIVALAPDRVTAVAPDDALTIEADVLSPNAAGGVLTKSGAASLRVRAVCGGANNQLDTLAAADALAEAGVLYAPDYVVNSGGIIQVSDELHEGGHDPDRVAARAQHIDDTLMEVFRDAEAAGITPEVAAEHLAERRIEAAAHRKRFLLP